MNTKNGFTLIEVLIGLFIAVVAATYAAKTITSTNKVVSAGRDTFIATNLAHQGIDLTRAMRDTTWFKDTDRTKWISKSGICETTSGNSYTIDPDKVLQFSLNPDDVANKVWDDSQPMLYYQTTNVMWRHEVTSRPTPYSRVLKADCSEKDNDPELVTITSTVKWMGQFGVEKEVSITEELYNWIL